MRFNLCISKGRSSLWILKNLILGLLRRTCFLHKISLIFGMVGERFRQNQIIIKKI